MNELVLTKESSNEQIKAYFNTILALSRENNEFPVNLDEVWMLVYGRKADAVEALQRDFMEGVDFQVLRQNPQNPNGGRPTNEYFLSVSCLEYFIARKVRPVFEVYRQVFHKVAEQKPLSHLEILVQSAQALLEQSKRIDNVERRLDTMEQEREENSKLLLSVTVSSEKVPQISMRDKVRQLVNRYAVSSNIPQRDVWHKIYDQLYYLYHISVKAYKKEKKETYLDVAERNHFIDKMYIVVSNLIRERNIA